MANRQLLARATEGTAAPTPGYLYNDLLQAAAANPMAPQEMSQYLLNRLESTNNPNIKYKCLVVLTKLCERHAPFQRQLAQTPRAIASIKECTRFQGPMDPVCGDAANQKVRTAAQACVTAVYTEVVPTTANTSNNSSSSMGSSSMSASYNTHAHGGHGQYAAATAGHHYSGGGGYDNTANTTRRMEGIGNPRYSDPRLAPPPEPVAILKDVAREAGDVLLGMIKDPLARNHHIGVHGNLPGSAPNGYNNSNTSRIGEYPGYAGRPPPGAAELAHQTNGQWTMASNRGPHSITREQEHYQRAAYESRSTTGAVGGSWGNVSSPTSMHHHQHGGAGPSSAPVSDGTYEKNLILELCPPGGLKAVPPPEKLASFAKMLPSLNADLVCPVLLDCLEEGQPWIVRAKALCVMETCLRAGTRMVDGTNPYRDFLHACQAEVVPLASHPRVQIQEPAKRVAKLLGANLESVAAPPVAAPVVQNLLDFDDAPAPAASAPTPASSDSMFGGMQVKAKSPTAAATSTTNGFSSPAAPLPTESLLDFVSEPAPAAANSATSDIFRDVSVKEPEQLMFQNMSIKTDGEDKKTDSEDAGDSVVAGSAFGFINGGSSASSDVMKPNFDPLSASSTETLSPSSAARKTMMQMQPSPEQMQAIAYQQMMLQQRLQMQMAYAMQQGMAMPPGGGIMPVFAGGPRPQGSSPAAGTASILSIGQTVKTDDHKFDFVKDAMKTQGKK